MATVITGTDSKYCYISTTTSQSSSSSNYQNIPYRMPTMSPVIYSGSSSDPLYYMPIAIWSTIRTFSNTVYYNNGTSTVTYPGNRSDMITMNQSSGAAMWGNGAGNFNRSYGSKSTPFFGRYRAEPSSAEYSNVQVLTGYGAEGWDSNTHLPPAAPIYASAPYTTTNGNTTYDGTVSVKVYNYAQYSAKVYIELRAGSTTKYTSSSVTVNAMTLSSDALSPGYNTFSNISLSSVNIAALTSIVVVWYYENGSTTVSYSYPVSFSRAGGSSSCGACSSKYGKASTCTCTGHTSSTHLCGCSGETLEAISCACGSLETKAIVINDISRCF